MFSKSFEVVTHSSDFKPPFVGSSFEAPFLSSAGASCAAGSGEQTSAAGFDGAGNELGPSSATCRGAGILPACALTVTRHTSYAAGDGSSPRDVGDGGASSGREHFRLRRRDKTSPCSVRVAGGSGGREHFRPRRRDKTSPRSVGVAGVSGGRGTLPSGSLSRSLGSACSSSRLVSSGRGAGAVGAETRRSASASVEARLSPRCLYVACLHLNVSRMCLTLSHVC